MKKMPILLAALFAAATSALADLYVTPTGAGAKDGSSWANAFAGIQAAVDFVDAAVAADPDYAIPVIHVADGTYSRVSITRDMALDVRSVNGAASTIIDGNNTNNCVDVRLSGYVNFGQQPTFTGFTLRNGNVRSLAYDRGGGAGGGTLVDCVIEDCQAWQGGASYNANTMRCIIRRCSAPTYQGGIVYGGNHVNDLMYGNSGNYALVCNASLYSCTVADNAASSSYYNFLYNSTARNCILWGNTVEGEPSPQDDANDPKFVGGGDYRLRAGSPAFDDGLEDWQTEAYVGLTDLAGAARVQGAKIDRGCYEGTALEGVLVTASAEGNGSVSPAHSFVADGASVTITADTSTWHRDVATWKTNGVVVAGATGNSFTFTATGEEIAVVAQFATLDWFVNGTTGSDTANNGRTASTAFKTIQHAIDCAAPEEQIFVAAGTYAPIDASRANVAIIGDGRDTTVIDGGGTTRCADLGERNFSYLQGFTLRNGRHMNVGTTPGQGEEGTGGGGAKGGFLIDCAIENCHSTFGGGAFHSEIHRSIIRDCSAYEGGGAIFGEYFNCLFDRNWAVQGGAASSASLWGCTVVRSRAVDFAAVYVSSAYSCIFWGNKTSNGRSNYWLLNHGECCFEEEMDDYNVSFTGDPLFVDPENGDFRLREDSPCIDCGWGGVLEDEFDVRGAGYPRRIDALHGEEIADMGCYEGGVPLSQIPQPPAPTAPRTIQVSGGGEALQNAINGASDGDTLVVANGTYSAIDARGKVLTIVSANGPAAAIIRGSSTTRAATLSESMTQPASTLAGFTVEGGTSTDLIYGGGGILGGYVSNCVVRGNSAYCGGGVAMAYVTHSIVSNNTATVSGGGACASWLDTCLVVHNAVNVNLPGFDLSAYGGGVPAANDNEAGGGGIAFSGANFCTITRNSSSANAGGAIFVILDNTYVAGNTAAGLWPNTDPNLLPENPIHVCSTQPWFNGLGGFDAATDDTFVDPDHGDWHLKATSLCVEGGSQDAVSHRYATDLDGNPRWRGSAPDIGCYEAAGAAPVVVPDVDAWTGPVWEGDEGVLVEWGVSRGAEWYTVHRSTTNDFAPATQVGRVDAPTTEFLDATAEISVRYRYWVVAHSTVGDGPVGDSVEGYWVPELVITTPYLPNGLTRELYSTNLAATGGMPPYTWTVETPSWLSVSGSTLSGMPRKAGDTTVTVSVEDADGQVDIRSWTLTIENNPAPLGPATPYAGEAYPGNYLIQNFDQLRLFEETLRDPDGFDFEGATFTLTADIDCGGRAFAPTNGACSYFNGTFDGQGHVISNYVNHGYSTGSLLGDAGHGAVVKDVTLVGDIRLTTLWDRWGTTALSENNGAAAFAEYVQAGPAADAPPGLTMLNCHFVGTVTNDQSGASGFAAAGLVAYVSKQGGFDASPVGTVNLRMSNCTVRAFVDGREGAGGLVAAGFGIEATDCSVTGGVYRATNIGGLGGFIRRSSFTDCSFDGEIDAAPASKPAEGGGGLVGAAQGVTLRRCAARASVCWEYPAAHDDDHTFTACGGAIGVSWDDTACYDCSFEGSIQSKRGFFGGFIGWADSAEVFSNCHVRATYAPDGLFTRDATGGFAGVVSSAGAEFVDCSAESLGGGASIDAGFFSSQQPVVQNISGIPYTVGTNSFLRCSTKNMTAYNAGFCSSAWNCSFRGCSVRGVASNGAGFVGAAGDPPGSEGYPDAQSSLFEDCSVVGARAGYGFAHNANRLSKNGSTNVFRRCRASGTFNNGFGALGKGSTAEDCAVVGMSAGSFEAGFAGTISTGATVRRCVGALMPLPSETFGAGFADSIGYDSVVEDCYSVYAPTAAAIYDRQEGGFVRSTTLGISSSSATSSGLDKIARCFTLGAIPATGCSYIGSFCGGTPEYPYGATYDVRFEDCYRPAESPVGDFSNQDHAGVAAFTRAEFANATAATMPNYDFQNVWHAPRGVASSPYLDASVDANTNFWFYAEPPSGTGFILVNDEAPREAYPAGARIKVKAVGNGLPFTGWIGEGFDDPTAQETWYTVRNVSAIGATFGTPIYTVDDFTNLLSSASTTSKITGNYVLMNDLDFTGVVEPQQYATSVSVDNFQGKFFGQGHTISGLCTTKGTFNTTFALFQKVSAGAEIRDLTVISSNVPSDENPQNTLSLAGLAVEVGSGVTISNCHAVVDWQGVYPAIYDNYGYGSCLYYGLARTVSGTDIHIVDCTVRGRLAGGTQACGFVGSASLTGGEIARCAVLADVSTLTNRTDGSAAGFAGSITLEGGAVVRECLSAGVVDAERDAFGFAGTIDFRDAASSFRDCYSTAEVVSHHPGYYNSYGIAQSISGYYEGNATIENVWFGGAVRGGRENRSFARSVSYANLVNCRSVTVADAPASVTDGVTDIVPAAARQSGSWTGFDFDGVWSMTDGSTTPYFAWSLADGNFRLFAAQEPGATISVPETAAPGSAAAVSAASSGGAFFCSWAGAGAYANAGATPTTLLADNHRTVRAVWGKAITTRAELEAIAEDPAGTYALGCDIDLGGEPWTPLCQDSYTPFTGTLYGNGHTISNLTVDTDGAACAGLFGRLQNGATVVDLNLANPVVRGANCVGTLAGFVDGATISGCTVTGADVTATSERAGCFIGQIYSDYYSAPVSVSRCSASGAIVGSGRYVGGFVGSAEGSAAIEQCYALASVEGTGGECFGSFVGYVDGDSVSISECFACGTVEASGRDSAGGFAGYVGSSPAISDCYALADVRGGRYVGGFAGQLYYCSTAFERCYAAGTAAGSSEVGGFAGRQYRGSPTFADCFRPTDASGDVGSEDRDGIAALDAAGFRDADNFGAYHDTGKWTQADGLTQPYFGWSLVDGKMTLSGTTDGTGDGSIAGLGAYAPGTVVQISAVPSGSVFLGWTGNAPYADPSEQTTTVTLDNFRVVTAKFGALITNRQQLDAMRGDPAGSYALGKDIDLSNEAWTPVGDNSTPFTGSLYAQGHKITGLRYDNPSGTYAGLFGAVKDATLDGIHLEGVSINGRQYTGALVGDVQGATTIRNCSAEGVVSNNYGYAGLLVGRVYGAGTSFANCAATGAVVAASQDTGGLVGGVYNYAASFTDCDAAVAVSGTSGNNKGGFVGSVRYGSASAAFVRCAASGDLVATNNSSNVGGFIGFSDKPVSFQNCAAFGDVGGKGSTGGFMGYSSGAGSTFADCSAAGDVRSTSSQTGGFVGYGYASNVFERCVAEGAVSGTSQTGGFVGQANGDRSQYLSCVANGAVAGTGNQAGGFVGQIGSTGLRFAQCSALGGVSDPAYSYVGGFVGQVSNSNDLWRCMCAGGAVAKQYVGGFVGYQNGGYTTIRECFALGDATALNTGDAYAGGFAGDLSATTYLSDSYCLGTVKGQQKVGGFAGRNYNSATKIERCYAAGVVDCTGTYAGAFIGYNQYVPTFADCAVLAGDFHAIGSNTAGSSTEIANVAEYDEAGMKSTAHFTVYRETGLWSQSDGITQPYLAWSAPNGKLIVYSSVGGSSRGTVDGAGEYDPGATARVTAVPDDGGFFVKWTGSTPYADASSPSTTFVLDNHRVASVLFGKYITTADELDAVRNGLAGVYGLRCDIDLAGRDWTPIGSTESLKFTGAFYGNGHAVKNLVCANNPSNSSNKWRGLFGCAAGATIDGVTVENCDIAGYQYVGALVGRIYDGTTITDCSASGKVYSYNGYAGGLVGSCEDGAFSIRGSSAAVEVTGGSNLGGFIGRAYGSGASVIVDCRADGFAGGTGSVGGFVGYVSAPLFATNCVARGDVKSTGSSYGGFVGYVSNAGATNIACWCSGAVWGTGNNIGSFVGQRSNGSFVDCNVYPYANGVRPFCGNSASITGGVFSVDEVKTRSAGWPKVAKRENTVPAIPIATVDELFAVTNNLMTNYVLTADIDLGGAAWTPIGQSTAFTGEFYGRNHAISNYTVTTTSQNAGLFGKIGGGRVSGVRAYGSVTGSNSYVGGFAGKVESYSMVDGCSFEGAVESSSTYVGGFVGQTYNSPNILRCCASGTVAKTDTSTSSAYIGGFVGQHAAGWISDSYALSSVNAGKAGYAGGFAGYVGSASSTRIATSYCSAGIATNSFSYIGAFGGNVAAGSVTNSYYNSGATALLAQGQSNKASIDYVGITPVAGADMKKQSSFPAFDFDATWNIDEGETMPYLLAFLVQRNAFMTWLEDELHMPPDTDPLTVTNGIPLLARYVYGIVPMNRQTNNEGKPLVDISIDGDTPRFQLAPQQNADDYGLRFSVIWSRNLTPWQTIDECYFDADNDGDDTVCHPPVNTTVEPRMFFKYRIEIEND